MRIASLSPAATEILFALRQGKEIVCTDQFSNFPEEAKGIPHVRGHQKVNPEELQSFSPELVLTGTVIQDRLSQELRKVDFAVVHQDPRTMHQIYESIRALGTLVGAEKEAEALILKMQQGFNDVKKKAGLLPGHPRLYEEWYDPPFASGNWVPEIAALAGGRQFPVLSGELSKEVTLDQMRAFDPDMIIISWCGAGSLAPRELLLKRPEWGSLRAIQAGRVRVIDDSLLNRPGLVEGAQRLYGWMFEMLH